MKLINISDNSEKVYFVPMGDVHYGNKFCDIEKFIGYIKWVKDTPNSYVFLMGDLFDVATRESPTSPFEQEKGINEAMDAMSEIIAPIKDKIIGAIQGNHCARLEKYAGFDIMETWCKLNKIVYAKYSAVIRFKIGNTKTIKKGNKKDIYPPSNYDIDKNASYIEYTFYAHHTTGGGQTIGGKLNRVHKLTNVFAEADCYLGGHNHSKAFGEDAIAYIDNKTHKIKYRRIIYVDCGSFQLYDNGYAEQGALPPAFTGAPRIRLSGIRKDIHVSF